MGQNGAACRRGVTGVGAGGGDWRPVHRLGQRGGPTVRPYHAARVAWAARGALTWPLAGARGRWGRGRASCPAGPGGAPGACERVGTRAGVRRQSACAELTRRGIRNVKVRAPKTSECVRRSVRNVRVRAPIHTKWVCVDRGLWRPRGGSHECERGSFAAARGPVMRIGAGTLMFPAQAL